MLLTLNAEHNSIFIDSHDIKHLVSKDYITWISYYMQNNHFYDNLVAEKLLEKVKKDKYLLRLCNEIDIMKFINSNQIIKKKSLSGGERN